MMSREMCHNQKKKKKKNERRTSNHSGDARRAVPRTETAPAAIRKRAEDPGGTCSTVWCSEGSGYAPLVSGTDIGLIVLSWA
jgi:hypothetical protein